MSEQRQRTRGTDTLRNEFTWSRSRARQFEECRRRYFYTYYGSWGGWEESAPPRTRQLYILKQLRSRHAWVGEVVHGVAERAIRDLARGITLRSEEEAAAAALGAMRRAFKDSREGRYRQQPKTLALFEHEYEEPIADDEWKQTADRAMRCIRNFFSSDVYQRLRSVPPADFLEVETLSSFSLGGIKVWVKLDCCLKAGPGVFVIDWKTGESDRDDHAGQLALYALYAAQRWGAEPRLIQTLLYNLATGQGQTYAMTESTVTGARDEIVASATRMRELLIDVAANEPQAEDAFMLTDNERHCRWCNYRRLCSRFAGNEGTESG